MLRRFAIVVAFVFCSAPQGWGQSPAPVIAPHWKEAAAEPVATPGEPCKIGVIPIAGDLFMVEKFGPLTFTDSYERTAVRGWALDDLVVWLVRAAQPGVSVRRIPFTKEEVMYSPARALYPDKDAEIRTFTQHVGRRISCDRYVVVHRYRRNGHKEAGIGVSNYLLDGHAYVFAIMYVRVYDGRTFELIKQGPAWIDDGSPFSAAFDNAVGGPYRALDPAMFPERPADVATSPVLRNVVRSLLMASLGKTLPILLRR